MRGAQVDVAKEVARAEQLLRAVLALDTLAAHRLAVHAHARAREQGLGSRAPLARARATARCVRSRQ